MLYRNRDKGGGTVIQTGFDMEEGKVFVVIISSTSEGKPIQTTAKLTPESAMKLCEGINKAASEATEWRNQHERNRSDLN